MNITTVNINDYAIKLLIGPKNIEDSLPLAL